MLRLLIDNKEVALSSDTSLELYRENPLLLKSGDYTYDIDIDLGSENNSIVYSGINRVNNLFNVTNREAVLIDGPNVVCRGKEIILEMNETTVKIQIVSGNSELNYIISNDEKVRDLDLGTIPEKSKEDIIRDIEKTYPEAYYNYPPLLLSTKDGDTIVANKPVIAGPSVNFEGTTSFRPQPFLLYYIDAVLVRLGYSVKSNHLLNNEKWKRLIVVNGYNTNEFAKMLPDWTVKEFFDQLQNFLNCVFLVNNQREVTITDANSYYEVEDDVYYFLDDVLDEFGRKFDGDSVESVLSVTGISYNMPNSSLDWKLANIDKTIWNKVTVEERVFNIIPPNQKKWDDFTVYKDPATQELYKTYRYSSDSGSGWITKGINFYADYSKDNNEHLSLSIVPALIINIEQLFDEGTGIFYPSGGAMVAMTSYYEYESDDSGFFENVTGDIIKNEVQPQLETAFYLGGVNLRVYGTVEDRIKNTKMVMCATKRHHCMNSQLLGLQDNEIDGYNSSWDLSPQYRVENEYSEGLKFDKKQKYVFRLKTNTILDPKKLFNIKNRIFICSKLTYRWDNLKLNSVVEGEFYALR